MTTILLALATSFFFGTGDFLGGVATRRDTSYSVTATAHSVSLVLLLVGFALMPPERVTMADIAFGAAAGVSALIGVLALLEAFKVGRMGIATAVSAALSAVVPTVFDLLSGTRLPTLTLAGMALALVAIVVVSVAPDSSDGHPVKDYRARRALLLAALSGVGFAVAFIALSFTSPASGFAPIIATRVVSLILGLFLAFRLGSGYPAARPALPHALGSGLADAIANITMLTALRIGPLAIASVLGSLFPVVVIVLARLFLGERMQMGQRVGVGMAVIAVLISAL